MDIGIKFASLAVASAAGRWVPNGVSAIGILPSDSTVYNRVVRAAPCLARPRETRDDLPPDSSPSRKVCHSWSDLTLWGMRQRLGWSRPPEILRQPTGGGRGGRRRHEHDPGGTRPRRGRRSSTRSFARTAGSATRFEDVVWVSEHAELRGDTKLGPDSPRRFLPSRFTPEGDAIDSKGRVCNQVACPKCHLTVPRAALEMEPLFVSVLGTPGSGKSYFLTAAIWKLREALPHLFGVAFADADLVSNQVLIRAEEELFLNPEPDELVWLGGLIRKTDAAVANNELYDSVTYGSHAVSYLRPYLFTVRPMDHHPAPVGSGRRMLCLYDNAGEHFLPGQDTAASPVTRHLALSRATLFLYDPTQDPRFRDACQRGFEAAEGRARPGVSTGDDPQRGRRAGAEARRARRGRGRQPPLDRRGLEVRHLGASAGRRRRERALAVAPRRRDRRARRG